MDLYGEPLIKRVIDRINGSKKITKLVLATTDNSNDDNLVKYMEELGVSVFRGSEENVLERVVLSAEKYNIENIVELHGDNPFLDPDIIDKVIDEYDNTKCDYISNTIKKTFPMGLRVQVFSTESLREIYNTVNDPAVNEHVSLYYYENPKLFKIINFEAPQEINRTDVRLTIDTIEDFKFASHIYEKIINNDMYPDFNTKDVLELIDNGEIEQSNILIKSKPVR